MKKFIFAAGLMKNAPEILFMNGAGKTMMMLLLRIIIHVPIKNELSKLEVSYES